MFALLSVLALSLTSLVSALPHPPLVARYFPQGTISTPANDTGIAPGASFPFLYNPRSDYCVYSHNFTVWLLTSPPSSVGTLVTGINGGDGESDGTGPSGYYFGRYSYSTNINEFPANPAPSSLTMPDFSDTTVPGWGATGSDVPMWLAVVEEWNECGSSMGNTFSLAVNSIVYNATSTSSTDSSSSAPATSTILSATSSESSAASTVTSSA